MPPSPPAAAPTQDVALPKAESKISLRLRTRDECRPASSEVRQPLGRQGSRRASERTALPHRARGCLGLPRPGPRGSGYEFEFQILSVAPDGTTTSRFADLFKEGCFLLEAGFLGLAYPDPPRGCATTSGDQVEAAVNRLGYRLDAIGDGAAEPEPERTLNRRLLTTRGNASMLVETYSQPGVAHGDRRERDSGRFLQDRHSGSPPNRAVARGARRRGGTRSGWACWSGRA